jgi:hypothetical protein
MKNWTKRLLRIKPKEPEGWQQFHMFDKNGNLLLVRKYGPKNSRSWTVCLLATSDDLDRATSMRVNALLMDGMIDITESTFHN